MTRPLSRNQRIGTWNPGERPPPHRLPHRGHLLFRHLDHKGFSQRNGLVGQALQGSDPHRVGPHPAGVFDGVKEAVVGPA